MWKTRAYVPAPRAALRWIIENPRILKDAFKGGLAPVVGLSLFQYHPFASTYQGIGFLVGIMTILSRCYQPRARYIRHIANSVGSICFGTCIALLSAYCAIEARLHTSGPNEQSRVHGTFASYNSSASVVAALFLFVNITFANAVRLSRPQLQHPLVMYSIFAIVTSVYIPTFGDMEQCISFIRRVLEAFLGSFGIATVIHFLVFPSTSRGIVMRGARNYVKGIKRTLYALDHCIGILKGGRQEDLECVDQNMMENAFGELGESVSTLIKMHEQQKAELVFAKREVAFGRLDARHLKKMQALMREIFLPLLGLRIFLDHLKSDTFLLGIASRKQIPDSHTPVDPLEFVEPRTNSIYSAAHIALIRGLLQSTQDVLAISGVLEIEKPRWSKTLLHMIRSTPPKTSTESVVTEKGQQDNDSRLQLRDLLELVRFQRQAIRDDMSSHASNNMVDSKSKIEHVEWFESIEFLVDGVANAAINFSDWNHREAEILQHGRSHLVHPGRKLMRLKPFRKQHQPWLHVGEEAAGADHNWMPSSNLDAKHADGAPLDGFIPMCGRMLHSFSQFFRSMEIVFGFRCACATMTVGVVAFLKDTQVFFIQQRLHWAMIMIAVGMSLTTGSGIFSLMRRVSGTLLGAVTVMALWYISGGHGIPGAVLPLSFIPLVFEVIGVLLRPAWASFFMLAMVTQSLILGYQLEEQIIGVKALEDSGQPYYPMYLLAPYRLVAVAGGCFVAFIWTYFPFPISDRTSIRERLGDCIYRLDGFVPLIDRVQILTGQGINLAPDSAMSNMFEQKNEAMQLSVQLATISQLRVHLDSVKFEPSLGRTYPTHEYRELVACVRRLLDIRSLILFAFEVLISSSSKLGCLKGHVLEVKLMKNLAEEIDTCLILASFYVRNRLVMPAHIRPPRPITSGFTAEKPTSVIHQHEPEDGSFTVLQVALSLLAGEVGTMLEHIRSLEKARMKQD